MSESTDKQTALLYVSLMLMLLSIGCIGYLVYDVLVGVGLILFWGGFLIFLREVFAGTLALRIAELIVHLEPPKK